MEVLLKMNNILSNTTTKKSNGKKKVTFKDPIPLSKIAASASNSKQTPKTVSSPRVIAKAIINKPLCTPGIVSGPITLSKYAQALADIINKDDKYPPRVALTITELAGAVLDDDPNVALEFANEIFDADSGQMLKYQKLLSHPKHHDV
jgi:hypothetical protein